MIHEYGGRYDVTIASLIYSTFTVTADLNLSNSEFAAVTSCTDHEIYLSIYVIESVRLFVCLFAVNAKTTARIDAKRSGITKNDPESVLCVLKLPVLVFLGRYRDIFGFSFVADRHFYLSYFHFRLLCRRLYNTIDSFRKRDGGDRAPHRYCFIAKGNFTS